jgi:DNA-binding NarL/FixJ family response regulator
MNGLLLLFTKHLMPAYTYSNHGSITCMVVADHQLCGLAVGGLLSEQCGLTLVAVCPSVAEAMVRVHQSPPGLLLIDLSQPGECWQLASITLRNNPESRLIMLKDEIDDFHPPKEILPNLLGLVDKSSAWIDLISLVNRWLQHSSLAEVSIAKALLQLDRLSPREREVFHALGNGEHNKAIAKTLGLSINTVETYRKSISAKLDLSGAELVRAAALHRCTHVAPAFGEA